MKNRHKEQWRYLTESERYQYKKQQRLKADALKLKIIRCRIAAAAILIVVLGSIVVGGTHSHAKASETGLTPVKCYTNVEVNKGDTLWAIADRYSDDHSDAAIMAVVDEIRELNHLKFNELICSGDKLVVPYYVYETD